MSHTTKAWGIRNVFGSLISGLESKVEPPLGFLSPISPITPVGTCRALDRGWPKRRELSFNLTWSVEDKVERTLTSLWANPPHGGDPDLHLAALEMGEEGGRATCQYV